MKALFTPDAPLKPLSISWEDGTEYEIEEVLDVCPCRQFKGRRRRHTIFGSYRQYDDLPVSGGVQLVCGEASKKIDDLK